MLVTNPMTTLAATITRLTIPTVATTVAVPMTIPVAIPMTSGGQDHPVDHPHAARDRGHPYDRDR